MKHFFTLACAIGISVTALSQKDSTKTPTDAIPVVTINPDDIVESSSDQFVAGMLNASSEIYNTTGMYRLNQGGFLYRGYRRDEFTTVVNGIVRNDLETGSSFWSGNGAFNGIFIKRTGNIGLAPSTFAFGGAGGVYDIDVRAGGQRKGLSLSYSEANRNFSHRMVASYSTGYMKGGWAVSVAASRSWAERGYEKGTYFDGYGYFLSVEKKFANKHFLSFTTFGTPSRGTRTGAAVAEMQKLANDVYYNPDWGYQNGQIRSANETRRFEPAFMLTHEAKFNNKTHLISGIDFEFGKNKSSFIDFYNANTPSPDFYRNLPSFIDDPTQAAMAAEYLSSNESARQIQWDNIYATNRDQNDSLQNANGILGNTVRGKQSKYVLANDVQDTRKVNFNTTLNHSFSDNISLTAGLTYQWNRTRHYKELADLLGGEYFVNLNQFAIRDFPSNADIASQNDLQNPNRVLHVGDEYGYNYNTNTHKTAAWIQPYFKFNHVEFFVSGQITHTYYWRTGLVQNGLYPTNSLGDSKKISMINYAVKLGGQYKINGKNYLFANALIKTDAPSFVNTFVSPRTRNEIAPNLTSENIYSVEAGYQFISPILSAKLTLYYTEFQNQMETRTFYHDDFRTFVNYNLSGIGKRHFGGDFKLNVKIYKGLSANLIANVGRFQYTNNPSAYITKDNSAEVLQTSQTTYLKNYFVGRTPQMSYSLGFRYSSPKHWYASVNFNYFDWMYVEVNPIRRTLDAIDLVGYGSAEYTNIMHQERLKGQFTMDLTGGYNWLLNRTFTNIGKGKHPHKYYLDFYANITNLTNNRNFVVSGTEQLRYDFQEKDVNKFATKYRYMHGIGYFVSVSFRMQ
jgi:hypothetical protein